MVFCQSVNAVWVVSILRGGRYTETLTAIIFGLTGGDDTKTSSSHLLTPQIHLWNFHYLIFKFKHKRLSWLSSVGRASVLCHTVSQQHARSQTGARPMLVHKYMEQMLDVKRSAGVTPDVNLKNLLYKATKHASKGTHPGFETQTRHHQKSKRGVSVAPQKGLMSPKNIFEKKV